MASERQKERDRETKIEDGDDEVVDNDMEKLGNFRNFQNL
jgi:hypothetical protein